MSFKCQARDLEAFWQIGTCGTNLLQVLLMLINIHFVGGGGDSKYFGRGSFLKKEDLFLWQKSWFLQYQVFFSKNVTLS